MRQWPPARYAPIAACCHANTVDDWVIASLNDGNIAVNIVMKVVTDGHGIYREEQIKENTVKKMKRLSGAYTRHCALEKKTPQS
jgi:purine nucleoside permease